MENSSNQQTSAPQNDNSKGINGKVHSQPNSQSSNQEAHRMNAQDMNKMGHILGKLKSQNHSYQVGNSGGMKGTFVRLWDRAGKIFGSDGNFLVFSKMFKLGVFPFTVLGICFYAIVNPYLLPWNSWETIHKRGAGIFSRSEDSNYDQFVLKSQKDAMFLELRQREVGEIETWLREHPDEKMTPKIRKRIRNGIIRDMMMKYRLDDIEGKSDQDSEGTSQVQATTGEGV